MFKLTEFVVIDVFFDMLVCPGNVIGHMERMTSYIQHGEHIRFQRIPDHQEFIGRYIQVGDEFSVILFTFFGNYFDMVEVFFQTRVDQLLFLVKQVTLGSHHETVFAIQFLKHFLNTVQHHHRLVYHVLAEFQDLVNDADVDRAVGNLYRSLNHREHKTLYAIPINRQIVNLGFKQYPVNGMLGQIVSEQFTELLLGFTKIRLIYPEGVICIKGNGLEVFKHQASGRT